jgi:hypothetical protein
MAKTSSRLSRGACVQIGPLNQDLVGVVVRAARDGSWADVLWIQATTQGATSWRKRQPQAAHLRPANPEQKVLAQVFLGLQTLLYQGSLAPV